MQHHIGANIGERPRTRSVVTLKDNRRRTKMKAIVTSALLAHGLPQMSNRNPALRRPDGEDAANE